MIFGFVSERVDSGTGGPSSLAGLGPFVADSLSGEHVIKGSSESRQL